MKSSKDAIKEKKEKESCTSVRVKRERYQLGFFLKRVCGVKVHAE